MNLSVKSSELKSKITHRVALIPLLLLFPSFSAFAAVCDAGYVSSTIEPQEYSQWSNDSLNSIIKASGSPTTQDDDVMITGSMTQSGTSQSINGAANLSSPTGGAFFIKQNMRSRSATNTITYKFDRPLSKLNMSVYDIDRQYNVFFDYNWKDRLQFTAKGTNGEKILPKLSNIGGFVATSGNIVTGDSAFFTFGTCSDNDFSKDCKVTASFDETITELSIEYGNASDAINNPQDQNIEIVFDNFCVKPVKPKSYTFSGTVFNDNDGITNADAADANLITGPYATTNTTYFNGLFNAPQETGITGSTVSLVNCAAPTTVYGTQTVSSSGTYQISAPASTISGNVNNICLIEERGKVDYPIRTNSSTRKITIQSNTLSYANINFGRVIAANAALVLQKYQFVNNCNASTLVYASVPMTNDPTTGFSINPIQGSITPQQCIAYKIVATNRANLAINDFVMSDVLQDKGPNSTQATSIRVAPTDANGSFATDSVVIGENGTVKTTKLTLPKKTKRDFYFNTKFRTIMNP